jgi:DNA (cytosine-5)-methyltransferase 1
MFFFTKAKRAQNVNDYESWNEGGVAPTLNAMDNNGEAYATVLIIDGTRVNDVRVYEDGIVPTVISRYGTGGGNVPMIFEQENVAVDFYNASISDVSQTIKSHSPNDVNIGGVMNSQVVRRLTPVECERLQGFPDDWTSGQADSNRYKQMGNAVAVPVVEWIISRMVGE